MIFNEFATTVDKTAYNTIKGDIENNYAIDLKGFNWSAKSDPEYNRVKYYILKGLEECLKIKIIKENLKEYEKVTGE